MFLPQPSLLVCMQQRLSADAAWGERMGRCGDVTSRKCHSSAYNETLPGISKHCSGNNTCMHHKSSKAVIKCLSDTGSEWKNMPLRLVFACVLSDKAYSTTHQFGLLQFVVLCLTCPLPKISLFRSFLRRSFSRSFFFQQASRLALTQALSSPSMITIVTVSYQDAFEAAVARLPP